MNLHRRCSELKRLRAWKAEAIAVLSEWEETWVAAGCPGPLGSSKARNTSEEVRRLQRTNERLRAELNRRYAEGRGNR